jgi:hypothetical protein
MVELVTRHHFHARVEATFTVPSARTLMFAGFR